MFRPLLLLASVCTLSLACATTHAPKASAGNSSSASSVASMTGGSSAESSARSGKQGKGVVKQASHTVSAEATLAPAQSRRVMMKRVLASNVRIFLWDEGVAKRSASAVVVGNETTASGSASYLITNAHALDTRGMTAPELRVVVDRPWEDASAEPMEFLGQPVAIGKVPEMDLALIRVIGVNLDAAVLAEDDELVPGDSVVVAAAPFGRAVSLSGGLVSHVEWDRKTGAPQMVKTDAPIGYGASGGGIYSMDTGHLLAIVEGYRTAKINLAVAQEKVSFDVPMPGETFAAPVGKVRAFLKQRGFAHLLEKRPAAARAAAMR